MGRRLGHDLPRESFRTVRTVVAGPRRFRLQRPPEPLWPTGAAFSGEVEDYVVVDVDPEVVPRPWLKTWQDGQLVDDEEKLAAIAQQESEQNAAKEMEESVRQKIKDGTATLQDVLEYLKVKDPSLLG